MSQRLTPAQLSSFAKRHSWLDGIETLCLAEYTSLEEARALLQAAVQRQEREITYNSLPTKSRVMRAVLENFPEPDARSFASALFGLKSFPWRVDWLSVAHRFEKLTSQLKTR